MEVIASKRLHRHAAPVALLLVGLLIVAAATLYDGTGHDLTKPLLSVKPTRNGLAQITRVEPQSLPDLSQAGHDAVLWLSLQASN